MKRRTFIKSLALAGAAFSIKPAITHVHKELDKTPILPPGGGVRANQAYVTTVVGGRTATLHHPFATAIVGYKAIDLFGNEVLLNVDNKAKGLVDVTVQNLSAFRRMFPTAYKVVLLAKSSRPNLAIAHATPPEQVEAQLKFLEQRGIVARQTGFDLIKDQPRGDKSTEWEFMTDDSGRLRFVDRGTGRELKGNRWVPIEPGLKSFEEAV